MIDRSHDVCRFLLGSPYQEFVFLPFVQTHNLINEFGQPPSAERLTNAKVRRLAHTSARPHFKSHKTQTVLGS